MATPRAEWPWHPAPGNPQTCHTQLTTRLNASGSWLIWDVQTGQKRRGGDSNPRNGYPFTAFPVLLLQPLGHLSGNGRKSSPVRGVLPVVNDWCEDVFGGWVSGVVVAADSCPGGLGGAIDEPDPEPVKEPHA